MCGILGYFGGDQKILNNLSRISLCSDSLKKRGPDAEGTIALNKLIVHHKRLSIIGLNKVSDQPFITKEKDSVLAFNGEIYNYKYLKKDLESKVDFNSDSDTEVLFWGLKIYGKKFINEIEGMFAFAYYDSKKNNLILARDRFGEKPLYLTKTKGGIFFSSDIKSLLKFSNIKIDASKDNFLHYLAHGYYPQQITPFENIQKVQSGTYIEINDNKTLTKKYWSIRDNRTKYDAFTKTNIRKELRRYINQSFISDVPISLSLSAGLDSSLIASHAKINNTDLNCFSLGYENKKGLDEREESRLFAESKNLKIKTIELKEKIDFKSFKRFVECQVSPIADISGYAQYKIAQEAFRNKFKVLLSGVGGDEIFFGYPYLSDTVDLNYKFILIKNLRGILKKNKLIFKTINLLRKSRRKFQNIYFLNKFIKFFYYILFFLSDKTPLELPISIALSGAPIFYNPIKNISEIRRITKLSVKVDFYKFYKKLKKFNKKNLIFWTSESIIETWLEGNLLSMSDSVGMANSVEIRAPFLSYKLNKLVNSYYSNKPFSSLDNKNLLREISKDLLPLQILKRPKTGFVPPVDDWIRALWNYKKNDFNSFKILKSLGLINENELNNIEISGTLKYRLIVADIWFTKILEN